MPEHPVALFAVQWHPELTASDDPVQQRLFDALVGGRGRALERGRLAPHARNTNAILRPRHSHEAGIRGAVAG